MDEGGGGGVKVLFAIGWYQEFEEGGATMSWNCAKKGYLEDMDGDIDVCVWVTFHSCKCGY